MGGWIAGVLGGDFCRGSGMSAESGMVQRWQPCERPGGRAFLTEGAANEEVGVSLARQGTAEDTTWLERRRMGLGDGQG